MTPNITPVLLLTGYLGSGKTTLLNRILSNKKGIKFAIIVNDIGEVNIDASLIAQGGIVGEGDDSLVPLQNGCICCTLKMDLVQQLSDIVAQQRFDYIVIEASGICEPAPIDRIICAYPSMYPNLATNGIAKLDSIVTVVDALRLKDEFAGGDDLTKDNIGHIITLLMADLNKRLVDKEITVELTDTAKQFITDNGYDPVYGARPLKRYLQKHVETLAAKLILADGVRAGDTILIDVKDGQLSASAVQKNA